MNQANKWFKNAILTSLVAPFLLGGIEGDIVFVGSEPEKPVVKEETVKEETEETCGYIFDYYPPTSTTHALHWFIEVSNFGEWGTCEDGFVWMFSPYEGQKALGWITHDSEYVVPLAITQNTSWFSNYRYRIFNTKTGESIPANLRLGKVVVTSRALQIDGLNPADRVVLLNNDKRFEICSADAKNFERFASFDYVVVGQNSGWASNYPNILINISKNIFVRARDIDQRQ